MCGICGVLAASGATLPGGEVRTAMRDALAHRGPDGAGEWTDAARGIFLGHRRLAVLDLSPSGRQPMESSCGRYVVSFNGEIYNFRSLREELEARGRRFRRSSDTEVLLEAAAEWGVEGALERFNGMFAFALWDRREERLWLARDRMGEKPLYYGVFGRFLAFASELKALRRLPGFPLEVDREALALYFRYGYVPAPWSIYRGVHKVRPGRWVVAERCGGGFRIQERPYWSLRRSSAGNGATGNAEEAVERLEELLLDAVRLRLESDVPLGAFLSGGVDSTAVVALMGRAGRGRVRTFTIGFHERGFDEAGWARRVAAHLGAEHTELYVTPAEARAVIPSLPEVYDEPFADSSQIPTCLVSRLARRQVTVALSGDGGDELFGGYVRYQAADAVWRKASKLPGPVRRGVGAFVKAIWPEPVDAWTADALAALGRLRGRAERKFRLRRLAGVLGFRDFGELYEDFMVHWREALVVGARGGRAEAYREGTAWPEPWSAMAAMDLGAYLPDDLLVKVDRASMAVGLEVRAPFLDPRVVEWALELPESLKVRKGLSKWVLRRVVYRHVPRELVDRPKMGFGVPMGEWLRGPLREWAEGLLEARRLEGEGFLRPVPVRRLWLQHLEGRVDGHLPLWAVLMFQAWLEREGGLSMIRRAISEGQGNSGTTSRCR